MSDEMKFLLAKLGGFVCSGRDQDEIDTCRQAKKAIESLQAENASLERAKAGIRHDLATCQGFNRAHRLREAALEKENATLRAKLEVVVRAAEAYKKRPLDIHDRPESWGLLDALLDAALAKEG